MTDRGSLSDAQILGLETFLLDFLDRRWASQRNLHADCVNTTLADVHVWIGKHADGRVLSSADLKNLSMRVLKCRIADHFRQAVVEFSAESISPSFPAAEKPLEETVLRGQALRVCMRFLAELPLEDRTLLLVSLRVSEDRVALSPGDRKKIQRQRERLRALLMRELGVEPKQLFSS